jgi:hypothetical protein
MQQMQKVTADRVIVGFKLDAPAVLAEVIPVSKHSAEGRKQPISNVARALDTVIVGVWVASVICRC